MSDYQGNIVIKNPATPTGPSAYGRAPGMWKLNEVAYWIKQGVWPNPAITPDQYFPYVSLLLSTTSLGNANNNLFVDSSGAFNPISRNGNTTQGSVTPYSASWSNFFDGSGDYFTVPYTAANFDWYTAGVDFTIEYWFLANSLTGASYVDGGVTKSTVVGNRSATAATDYWSFGPNAGGTVTFYYFNGGPVAVNSTSTITANTWNHVAMTKTSSGITIFVNGVAQTTTAISGTPQSSASFPLTVGQGNNTSFNGYVSNLRVVRGTAIYSGNFTPPTQPLTAVTNTTLLTCQSNRFRDASTNNLTLTVTGNTSVTDFSPFSSPTYTGITYNQSDITNWSGYLNGSSYWTVPTSTALDVWDNGAGSFTVEAWIFATTSIGNNVSIVAKAPNNGSPSWTPGWAFQVFNGYLNVNTPSDTRLFNSNTTSVPLNEWVHCALVKSGSTVSIYQNGTRVGTTTNSTAYSNTTDAVAIGVDRNFAGSKLTGYVSNVRMVKGTAVYDPTQSTLTVPTTNLTAVSGTSLLTLQNAAFADNSTNNFIITQNGNPTVTGNSPFNTVGYWSNYFNGGTNYLSVNAQTALSYGTGDFTLEAWVNPTSYNAGFGAVLEARSSGATETYAFGLRNASSVWYVELYIAASYRGSIPVALNTWTHIAVSRSSGTLRIFVNGVLDTSWSSITTAINANATAQWVGALRDGAPYFFHGYISNFRAVKGAAVYTSTFTVPTTPLTAISGTSLLTCQNGRFIDNSTNAFTITPVGTPSVQSFDPFYASTIASNGGSMYFDGTGDYLVPANGQQLFTLGATFTLDFWVYLPAAPAVYAAIVDTRTVANLSSWLLGIWNTGGALRLDAVYAGSRMTAASTVIPVGAWTHVTFSQVSGVTRFFVNGVADSTTASSVSWNSTSTAPTIGTSVDNYYFPGYMAGFRLVKGSGVSANFTPPTTPVTPTPNTVLLLNGMNAGAYDAAAINDMETVGNAQVSTAVSKFGGSSVYFDGTGDYLSTPASPAFDFGTGDFTLECWVYRNNSGGTGLFESRGGSAGLLWYIDGTNQYARVYIQATAAHPTSTITVPTNQWVHLAVTRSSGVLYFWMNGQAAGSSSITTSIGSTATLRFGASNDAATYNGYIDDMRITKGVARYTANFTPPTQAFPTY